MSRATIEDLRRADRVLLYGVTGAGKSTGAGLLGEVLGLPVHLVDEEIGWLPGWVMRDEAQQRSLASELVAEPRWVLDSTYGSFKDVVLPRAQVVVALDYPRWLTLARLLRRTTIRLVTQEEMCNGNTEGLRQIFSRDSILVWHFRSFARKRARMRAWEADPHGIPVLRLTHPRELDDRVRHLSGRDPR